MTKIKLFTDSLGAGGAQRQLVGLAVLLKDSGYDVSVVVYYNIPFYAEYLSNNDVPYEVLNISTKPLRRILSFFKFFKHERPDWVIAYQETPSLVAVACRVLGCRYRVVVSERNTTQSIGLNERIRFFLYHFADSIVPNSYTQEKFLLERYIWMKTRLTTITNFVDLELFSPISHVKRDVPEILIVASVFFPKNVLGFIESVRILKSRGIKFHVSWYGLTEDVTPYYLDCFKKISDYDLNDCFSLLEKTKEVHLKYKEADYFCLPSLFEGTPNVICEAIASGLPVMCSDVCDNGYYVKDNVNGILFDPNSSLDMADKMELLLKQTNEEYQLFCRASRQIAEERLSKNKFIDKYLSIINTK